MIALWLSGALASEPPDKSDLVFEPRAELRLIETLPDTFALDADGTPLQWGRALDSRLRMGLTARDDRGRAALQLDLFTGQLAGSTWNLPELDERGRHTRSALTMEGVVPRVLSVGTRQPWFDLEVGLQTSHWGLGLVANDGGSEPLFGRTDFGDRVLRARLGTQAGRQLPLFFVLAGDLVVADELARLSEGDRALQAILATLYRTEQTELGLYGVLRAQDRVGIDVVARNPTRVSVFDAFARRTFTGERLQLELAAEGALIMGRTGLSRTYQAPEGVRVRSGGLAARAVLRGPYWALHQRLALASGDRSPDDGRVTDFRFDRDHDVGFVLFEEVQSAIDLRTIALVSDPSVAASPPEGIESLAAEGAFHQALALQDALTITPSGPLALKLGGLLAWSTAPIAHPFYSFRNGGVPLNVAGQPPGGRFLGSELDWAVGLGGMRTDAVSEGERMRTQLTPSLWLQGGHAWPSVSYAGELGRVDHLLVVFRLHAGRG